MLIANQKLKENIAEYIIYIWQIENLIRSLHFNIKSIEEIIIQVMTSDEDAQEDIKAWYLDIIEEMKQNELEEKGHLQRVQNVVEELIFLHNTLLTSLQDKKYQEIFAKTYPFIEELRKKSKLKESDIEICLIALYGKLLLKMQQKTISKETDKALTYFTKTLAYLAVKYKEFRTGKLKFQLQN